MRPGPPARLPARPPEQRLHPRHQLHDTERLGEIVVGAAAEPAHLVRLVRPRGEHQHREARARRPGAAAAPRTHPAREHDVEHQKIERLLQHGQPGGAVPGDRDVEALVPEIELEPEREIGIVLDDQDAPAHTAATGPSTTTARAPPSGLCSSQALPPCACASWRTTESPMPLPPLRRSRSRR